jgi:hypothetical protein
MGPRAMEMGPSPLDAASIAVGRVGLRFGSDREERRSAGAADGVDIMQPAYAYPRSPTFQNIEKGA